MRAIFSVSIHLQEWAARYWRDNGVAPEKLIIGLATYGRSFKLLNGNNNVIGAPAVGSGGSAGPYTGTVGFLSYYEVNKLDIRQLYSIAQAKANTT